MTPGQVFTESCSAPRTGGRAFPIGQGSRRRERCATRDGRGRAIRAQWGHDLLRRPSPSFHALEPARTDEERWLGLGVLTLESRSIYGSLSEVLPRLNA